VKRLRAAAVRSLDRPAGRRVLALLASAYLSATCRKPILVRRHENVWAYRWRGAVLPHPTLGSAVHPEQALRVLAPGYVPQPGDVVLDVGAGVGDTALLFSRLVGPNGKVVAIEAHPETHRWLVRLCRLNSLENIVPLQVATADQEGELLISSQEPSTNTVLGASAEKGLAVRARRLDAIAADLGLERVDLLKMNIEGAERAALLGMPELIRRTRHVCISCHNFLADAGGREEMRTRSFVEGFLSAHGFTIARTKPKKGWRGSYVYATETEPS
jgi:FkbM family methyltransferase